MRSVLRGVALMLGIAVLGSGLAAQERKEKPAKNKEAAVKDLAKPTESGMYTGRIVSLPEGSKKQFTVEVARSFLAPNTEAKEALTKLDKEYKQVLADRGMAIVEKRKKLASLVKEAEDLRKNLSRVETVTKKIELRLAPDLKVRTEQPPMIEEDGKSRKPNAKELKVLKGPDLHVPGYKADPKDLKEDQLVRVHLSRAKAALAKGGLKDEEGPAKPAAAIIVILTEQPKDAKDKK